MSVNRRSFLKGVMALAALPVVPRLIGEPLHRAAEKRLYIEVRSGARRVRVPAYGDGINDDGPNLAKAMTIAFSAAENPEGEPSVVHLPAGEFWIVNEGVEVHK